MIKNNIIKKIKNDSFELQSKYILIYNKIVQNTLKKHIKNNSLGRLKIIGQSYNEYNSIHGDYNVVFSGFNISEKERLLLYTSYIDIQNQLLKMEEEILRYKIENIDTYYSQWSDKIKEDEKFFSQYKNTTLEGLNENINTSKDKLLFLLKSLYNVIFPNNQYEVVNNEFYINEKAKNEFFDSDYSILKDNLLDIKRLFWNAEILKYNTDILSPNGIKNIIENKSILHNFVNSNNILGNETPILGFYIENFSNISNEKEYFIFENDFDAFIPEKINSAINIYHELEKKIDKNKYVIPDKRKQFVFIDGNNLKLLDNIVIDLLSNIYKIDKNKLEKFKTSIEIYMKYIKYN